MKFKNYVIVKTEKELRALFIILNAYQTTTITMVNLNRVQAFVEALYNRDYIMLCIEDTRISYSYPGYMEYINDSNLKQIDIKEIFEKW